MTYAFDTLGYAAVVWCINPQNVLSQAAITRIGGTLNGREPQVEGGPSLLVFLAAATSSSPRTSTRPGKWVAGADLERQGRRGCRVEGRRAGKAAVLAPRDNPRRPDH
ncbi:GNAT family protein [Dactylosporangium sp. NPDC050588]|uniref:GNAT family protein n=1 Tax=Dactylosporangium sp. NPDC050588 TaxID=3157211 RepID=UPI0033CADBA6